MGVTAAIVGTVIAAGGTTYSIVSAEKAKHKAERAAEEQKAKEASLLSQEKEKERIDTLESDRDAARAKQRQAQLAAAGSDTAKTLLTPSASGSVLGTSSSGGTKSLLGM